MARSSAPRPPSVDRLVAAIAARNGADGRDREAVVRAAREVIATERARMAAGAGARPLDELAALVMALLVDWGRRQDAPRR